MIDIEFAREATVFLRKTYKANRKIGRRKVSKVNECIAGIAQLGMMLGDALIELEASIKKEVK